MKSAKTRYFTQGQLAFVVLFTISCFLLLFVSEFLPVKPKWNSQAQAGAVEFVLPPVEDLQKLSHEQLAALYHKYINNVQVLCKRIVRIGLLGDGGWEVCEDALFSPTSSRCLVYSFGVGNDFSFDDHMMNRYKCAVHSFDPSMDVSEGQRGTTAWFHKIGLSDRSGMEGEWNLKTFKDVVTLLGHTNTTIDVLKIDIEQYEWQSLIQMFEEGAGIKNVRQLLIELHIALVGEPERLQYYNGLVVLKYLYDHGFRIIYSHRNLWCKFLSQFEGIDEVGCHEVSFVFLPS